MRAGGSGAAAMLAVLLVILLAGGGAGEPGSGGNASAIRPGGTVGARVLRVIDGDTVEVELDGDTEDVRYIGVDTPETVKPGTPVQCFGPEASARNHELVEDRRVRLRFDHELRDDYGRLLAYVYAGGHLVNAELVQGGYARTLEFPPNTTLAERLAAVQGRAGEAGRGLWSAC
jgi:micrococcal nuclease